VSESQAIDPRTGKVWSRERWEWYCTVRDRRRKKRARRWATFRFALLGAAIIRGLPLGLAAGLGALLGRLVCRLDSSLNTTALRHLEIALGDRTTPDERKRIVSRLCAHLGRSLFEFVVYAGMGTSGAWRSVVGFEGEENLRAALASGKGAICVTPHFGLWELLPSYLGARFPGCVVGTPPTFRPAGRLLTSMRASLGVEQVSQSNARGILRRLRSGQCVGILPDQDIDHLAGIFLPFFGREAYTLTGPATLAWTAKSAVVPLLIRRVGPHHHRVEVSPQIEIPRDRPRDEWIRDMTVAISKAMEDIILSQPDQWVWFHERWATTPEYLEGRKAKRSKRDARRTRWRAERENGIRCQVKSSETGDVSDSRSSSGAAHRRT
jgi:Kdo2-lipid IVA lauroyltransferase/acyltransferase